MAHEPAQLQHTPVVHETTDPWHHHTAAEGRPQHEHGSKIDPAVLSVTFGLIVFVVLALAGGLTVYFVRYSTQLRQARMETTVLAAEAERLRAEAEATFAGYAWADPAAGHVAIPLEQAIDRVIDRYGSEPGVGAAAAPASGETIADDR